MLAKDYAIIQRMLGQIEGAILTADVGSHVSGIICGAVTVIDEKIDLYMTDDDEISHYVSMKLTEAIMKKEEP